MYKYLPSSGGLSILKLKMASCCMVVIVFRTGRHWNKDMASLLLLGVLFNTEAKTSRK
jgi:hypothetical protein